MFQSRLKKFLVILLVVTGLLMLRALQLQVFERGRWTERAARVFASAGPQLLETTRGRILDFKGREVAIDNPCVDLCVDFRAIALLAGDEEADTDTRKWLRTTAARRLANRMGAEYTGLGKSAKTQA